MSEIQTSPEVLLRVLGHPQVRSLEIDEDSCQEIVVDVAAASVLVQEKFDVPELENRDKLVDLSLADDHDPLSGFRDIFYVVD